MTPEQKLFIVVQALEDILYPFSYLRRKSSENGDDSYNSEKDMDLAVEQSKELSQRIARLALKDIQ